MKLPVFVKTVLLLSIYLSWLLITPVHAVQNVVDPLTGLTFVTIPAGQFVMGTENIIAARNDMPDPKDAMIDDETPAHTVIFKEPFSLSQTEVTQKIWHNIMGTKPGPDSHWQSKDWQRLPVVSVSWHMVNNFINQLNQQSADNNYRLPTEAEWEYSARAGTTGLRPFSVLAMDEYAWYINSSNDQIQTVAQLKPNAWGLYDMYGNVWEWVADWYSPSTYEKLDDAQSEPINPQGPKKGNKKIRRGGSYHCPPHLIRPAYRAADNPNKAYSVLGFRLIIEKKHTKK